MFSTLLRACNLLVASFVLLIPAALAQSYPAKPLRRSSLALMLVASALFDQQSGAHYVAGAIAPIIRTDSPPVHLFGSTNEICPLTEQSVYYAALNAAGRNHYDGTIARYASVASPRDTFVTFTGTNHADYPGAFDMYLGILRRDLGAGANVTDVVLVGCGNTQPIPAKGYGTILRSTDGGTAWTPSTSPGTNVSDVVIGTTGQWWRDHGKMLGRGSGSRSSPRTTGRWGTAAGTSVTSRCGRVATCSRRTPTMRSTPRGPTSR